VSNSASKACSLGVLSIDMHRVHIPADPRKQVYITF